MKKVFFMLFILLILASFIAGCSGSSKTTTSSTATSSASFTSTSTTAVNQTATTTVKPKYGGTLKMLYDVGPGGPFGYPPEIVGESGTPAQLCMEGLVKMRIDGTIEPLLATSWESNPQANPPSIIFHLRQGVKFHDNSDFNAEAVKFNFDGQIEKKVNPYWKSVEVIDTYTVRVNFTQWRNTLINGFGDATTGFICSQASFQKNGLEWTRVHPVGTGPFIFESFERDASFKAVRNPNYWQKGKPYLDAVEYIYVSDTQTRRDSFISGMGDAIIVGLKKEASDIKAAGFDVIIKPQAVNSLIPDSLNADSPFAKVQVRQAIEYAINKEDIAKGLGFGLWEAPYQIPPRGNPYWDSSVTGRKYDVSKAKQLLIEAGYPNGFKTTIIPSPTASFNKDVCVAIQSFLKAVNIETDLQIVEYAKYLQYRNGSWNNALLLEPLASWTNYNQTLSAFFTSNASTLGSVKKSDEFVAAFNTSQTSVDADKSLINKVLRMISDDALVIPVYEGGKGYGVKPYVKDAGFITRGFPLYWDTENAWIDK